MKKSKTVSEWKLNNGTAEIIQVQENGRAARFNERGWLIVDPIYSESEFYVFHIHNDDHGEGLLINSYSGCYVLLEDYLRLHIDNVLYGDETDETIRTWYKETTKSKRMNQETTCFDMIRKNIIQHIN